jgi:CelD/BcsL family acetyltransferase involved in cellulose biosynthesis
LQNHLKVLDIRDRRWTSLVLASPDAVPIHRPEWAELLAHCYGYRAFAFCKNDTSGHALAGLPLLEVKNPLRGRRWVSLPFTDHCPPLGSDEQGIISLIDQLDGERRNRGVPQLEVRALLPGKKVHHRSTAVMHTLRLSSDPDEVFRTFKPSVQRAVVKAEREGVIVRFSDTSTDLVRTFYRLHTETRARLGIPVQSRRYFRMLWHALIEPGFGFVLLASAKGQTVAAAVFLAWNGTITYKYGASSPRFWRLRPNNLLFSTAIRWGCEHGYRTFSFGRTDLSDEGLRAFKRGWGTHEEPLVYSTLGELPSEAAIIRLAARLRPVIRRMPPWVCRLVGEFAYRYAA